MSSSSSRMDLSGTPQGFMMELLQRISDLELANQHLEDRVETVTSERDEYKDELDEFKAAREVIAPGDPDATSTQWDDDEEEEYEEEEEEKEEVQDDGESYHAMIQALEKVEEEKKGKNRALFGLVVAQMDVANKDHMLAVRDDIIDEKNRIIAEKDRRIEVVTGERDSATATMFRERAAHIKAKDGVSSGRVTKNKSKTVRLLDVVADNMSLTLRQKKKDGSL